MVNIWKPLRDRVLGEAAPRRQIDEVELADGRRNDQRRDLAHLRGRRLVMQELESLGAQHDRARRRGDVLADLEVRALDLRRHAVVVAEIVDQVLRAPYQALAARFDTPA